jgi:hypothetical protein
VFVVTAVPDDPLILHPQPKPCMRDLNLVCGTSVLNPQPKPCMRESVCCSLRATLNIVGVRACVRACVRASGMSARVGASVLLALHADLTLARNVHDMETIAVRYPKPST